ncbi:hypothetical protein ABZX39_37010 [Streptomyces collinus]
MREGRHQVPAAVGRPRLIRGEDIKPGAVVIDAGYNPGNAANQLGMQHH